MRASDIAFGGPLSYFQDIRLSAVRFALSYHGEADPMGAMFISDLNGRRL